MRDTVLAVFNAALKQYAKRKAGDYLACQYIAVPHQLPPKLMDSTFSPPDKDGELPDRYVLGDHDFHACVSLIDGLDYVGHQAIEVRRLAQRELRQVLDSTWQESVLCDLYSGTSMHDPDYKRMASDLPWDCLWPEVDADFCLTGGLVDDGEGYASVMNEAMMQESVAEAAGLVVEDGHVHTKQEVK